MARAENVTMEESVAIKNRVAEEVLSHIKSNGGRFVRKTLKQQEEQNGAKDTDDSSGKSSGHVIYEEVSDREAMDKIKQTLRFQIERRNGPRSRSKALEALRAFGANNGGVAVPSNQAMNDQLLKIISQERIAKLIQGKKDEMKSQNASSNSSSFPTSNSTLASSPAITGLTSCAWQPLLSAMASPVAAPATKNMNPCTSLDLSSNGTPMRDTPQLVETSLGLRYLSLPALPIAVLQRPNPAVNQQASVTFENFASLAAAAGITKRSTQTHNFGSALGGSKSGASSGSKQSDLAKLIQQEELKLMLEKIKTRRLSEMLLQQSNTNSNGK
ncbi:MAG: hypothetical protein SGILL_008611 [Bacillariaceae sp.]